ncbi:MAG: amidohydrolase family protein [Gemmatimonadetes bacterium]|nr:amidohydrolase family protein [Gemmatimonadota bacterium]
MTRPAIHAGARRLSAIGPSRGAHAPLLATLCLAATAVTHPALAQRPAEGSEAAAYVAVDAESVALQGVTLIDGTGGPPLRNQTIVLEGNRIAAVGPADEVGVPEGAQALDLSGHTVMPGMVGLHDHLFYMAAGGRMHPMSYTGQRLYLGSGVTSIRTTGSLATYAELNLKDEIERGLQPGPRIHITAPYMTGDESLNIMTRFRSPEQARRFVRYWAAEGATWLKAYTTISTDDLAAAIDEAHKAGIKVTGHLCSISFTEAVALGIDNIEHGLSTNSDYSPTKVKDECPADLRETATSVDVEGPEVAATFRAMIDNNVAMTSTLAVYELFVAGRPTRDARTLAAMAPSVREDYLAAKAQIDEIGPPEDGFLNAMAYEKAFYDAGGVLAAGVDPTGNGGALAGYGDQRNYELFIEAGFAPSDAVKVLSSNGARVLGVFEDLGTVEAGKIADLVVMRGDLTANPSVIREVTIVFKDGIGYDSPAMLDDVIGRVGIN